MPPLNRMFDAAYQWSVLLPMLLTCGCTEPTYGELTRDAAGLSDCESGCAVAHGAETGDAHVATKTDEQDDARRSRDAQADDIEPRKEAVSDAEAPREAATIAPSQTDGGPAAAHGLVGDYAVIARFFGWDSAGLGGSFSEEIVSRASIQTTSDGKFTMTMSTCEHRGEINTVVVAPVVSRVLWPQRLPPHHYELNVTGDTFETFGAPVLAGYEELSSAACPAGTTQSHLERSWLPGGQCTCPISELPPTQVDDCRIVDADDDREPGLTVQFTGGTENLAHSRIHDGSRIVQGVIDPKGKHRASFLPNVGTYHLECLKSSCTNRSARVCPAEFNPVRFVPLPARADGRDWVCDDIMLEIYRTGHFGLGPATPPDC